MLKEEPEWMGWEVGLKEDETERKVKQPWRKEGELGELVMNEE